LYFIFTDPAPTKSYTLSLHDALPISTALTPQARALLEAAPPPRRADEVALRLYVPAETVLVGQQVDVVLAAWVPRDVNQRTRTVDRKSTRLNSSHVSISYAVFCLKKK